MEIKKTAIDLTDLAIGLIVLGIVVTIGANILITARDARLTDLSVATTNNETLASVSDGSTTALANGWAKGITACINSTSNTAITSANYTFTVNPSFGVGSIKFAGTNDGLGFNGSAWKCTYTWYNTSRADWTLANKSAIGIGE